MKTFKIFTLGCKVNQYDTQSIREKLLSRGFAEANNGKKCGYHIINTCTVTASADRQSRLLIRSCVRASPRAKVIVTGCLVEKDVNALATIPGIDFIVSKSFFPQGISSFSGRTRAFLKIQDGCNNFCSYCKVPLVRGISKSRPLKEIVKEAEALVKNGFKEIVLSGICLGSYGLDLEPKLNLIDAIEGMEKIDGLLRLRLSSIEAFSVSDELIDKIAKSKKICPHLHIPIQSGDDGVLEKMNRQYTAGYYLNLIKKIRKHIPKIAITTDVLVGFPGEGRMNFENTVNLVRRIKPLKAHIFPYSKRQGTIAAANFKDEVNQHIIKERISRLNTIAESCSLKYKEQFIGNRMQVLIEGASKENPGYWEGYTDNYIRVIVKSKRRLKNKPIILKLKKLFNDFVLGGFN